nr:reverse transcriptase domain-containing protein [Tanacetum cinerariifolium]
MADQHTMAELLRATTEGYAEEILVLPILAEHFELKHSLINMMTLDQFFGLEKDNPHDHIRAAHRCSKNNPSFHSHLIQASMSTQTNELKNMMASFFQMNTASISGSRPLLSNTIANPKGKLKAITTRSGLVLDGPSVSMPHPFINPEEDERVEETLTDLELAEYTIKVPPPLVQKSKPHSQRNYMKMLKALLSNKEKLLELANTPLNENCSAVIHKNLHEKLRDPGKFLIPCGFSELKCKALADLGAIVNLMPLRVWKKLGLPELISTRMTLELANWAICTPAGIARDVFVLVGKFTFPADFVIVDYESDPPVPLILGRPFLRTASALIDVHGEEMILRDDIEFDLREIEYLLNHDPTKELDSILEDSIDESNLADPNNNLVDTILEMFTDEHTLDYSSPPLYDDVDDDLIELESDNDDVYDDPFDSKEYKIKESKLLIDEIDPPRSSDFLPSLDYNSVLYKDFSEVDTLPLTDNKGKVFNPGILIHENLFEVIVQVVPDNLIGVLKLSKPLKILKARCRFFLALIK